MNKFIAGLITGAVAGAAAAYFYLKDKFAKIADDEIESVKEVYRLKREKDKEQTPEPEPEKKEEPKYAYSEEEEPVVTIYRIPDSYFGAKEGYKTEVVDYYPDGVFVDQYGEVIDNPDEILDVIEVEDTFTRPDREEVYIRNENTMTDYQVLRNDEPYAFLMESEEE